MKEVILAKSAGFCFGVQRAMDTVYAEADKENVYTYSSSLYYNSLIVKNQVKKWLHFGEIACLLLNFLDKSHRCGIIFE